MHKPLLPGGEAAPSLRPEGGAVCKAGVGGSVPARGGRGSCGQPADAGNEEREAEAGLSSGGGRFPNAATAMQCQF